MKTINILYWVFNILFAGLMLFSAIPNIMVNADSIAFVSGKLGYPEYIIPFLGVAKLVGVIGILVPRFPRIKEWAYAGLTFDLVGAAWSVYSVSTSSAEWMGMVPFLLLPIGAYYFYIKRSEMLKQKLATA